MPLGILSDEEMESEISKLSQNNKQAKIIDIEKGRGPKAETPESARKLIAELAISGAYTQEISKEFNISASSISAYKNGANSTASYNESNPELTKSNNSVRERIASKARKKLIRALNCIDNDKLSECKARDLSGIAKDMSSVIKNMEPEVKDVQNGTQFIFFAPHIRKESDYSVIDVLN